MAAIITTDALHIEAAYPELLIFLLQSIDSFMPCILPIYMLLLKSETYLYIKNDIDAQVLHTTKSFYVPGIT